MASRRSSEFSGRGRGRRGGRGGVQRARGNSGGRGGAGALPWTVPGAAERRLRGGAERMCGGATQRRRARVRGRWRDGLESLRRGAILVGRRPTWACVPGLEGRRDPRRGSRLRLRGGGRRIWQVGQGGQRLKAGDALASWAACLRRHVGSAWQQHRATGERGAVGDLGHRERSGVASWAGRVGLDLASLG